MQIIPVIDVMGGIVVHASGGIRDQYQPLQSVLTSSCEPIEVISELLARYKSKIIYIADIDAIRNHHFDIDFYTDIHHRFPNIEFWLDAGIRTGQDWQMLSQLTGIRCVIGTETLIELDLLTEPLVQQHGILSLDYQNDSFLGKSELLKQTKNWPQTVIVMSLDSVGAGQGPDYNLLTKIKKLALDKEVIAAGGVSSQLDLVNLTKQGIEATLVASALHNGTLSSKLLNNI